MTNLEYANGLRAIADLYERHPELKLPYLDITIHAEDKADFIISLKALSDGGTVAKSSKDDPDYPSISKHIATREFSGVTLEVEIYKSVICRKVRKTVTREIETWECPDSLMEPEAIA